LYADTTVARVDIAIDPDSLARILDPANVDSDHEYPARLVFANGLVRDTADNVGFRLRGNTSRTSRKKSFKVSINAFVKGRTLHGVEKLDLNGEHNDPSIIRAKLTWDLYAAVGAPGARAAHARLYINGAYRGLYISVEHIDENFALSRFGNNDGNLYKCLYPADLAYRGSDPALYKHVADGRRVYELTINEERDDYNDLAAFIALLNLTPDAGFPAAMDSAFNVNAFLRILAVDIATGNWDDYWFNKNNFYLYHNTATGRFEYVPYDCDNTFGIWWTSIMTGVDWGTRPPLTWGHPTDVRPLTARILSVPAFRDRLVFYLRRLVDRHFSEAALFPRIDSMHAMITPAAVDDNFRTLDYGFTVQQFHDSYTQPLGAHVVYGLKQYVTARRTSALAQLPLIDSPPILSDAMHSPRSPVAGDTVRFRVRVEDESHPVNVVLLLTVNGQMWEPVGMFDDGVHWDGVAGDEVYGAGVTGLPVGAGVTYAVRATDAASQVAEDPPAGRVRSFRVNGDAPRVRINEFMAKNDTTITDPAGEVEDWIELVNADSVAVRLAGWYLTDNLAVPAKWALPDTTLARGAFLLVWADDTPAQGPLHATFKLERGGERIGLSRGDASNAVLVDSVSFGYQQADVACGRVPDGEGAWQALPHATPGSPNLVTNVKSGEGWLPAVFSLDQPYPNPFNPQTAIGFHLPRMGSVLLRVFDVLGREVARLAEGVRAPGYHVVEWEAGGQASGVYIIRLEVSDAAGHGQVAPPRRVVLVR
jgi:hypothetical protein